jgi:hypothetical protein
MDCHFSGILTQCMERFDRRVSDCYIILQIIRKNGLYRVEVAIVVNHGFFIRGNYYQFYITPKSCNGKYDSVRWTVRN